MAPVVLLADGFMLLMVSRPSTGSLRNTWVTPGTMQLSALLGGGVAPLSVLLLVESIRSGSAVLGVVAVALLLLAVGSLAVLAVGVMQRRSPVPLQA